MLFRIPVFFILFLGLKNSALACEGNPNCGLPECQVGQKRSRDDAGLVGPILRPPALPVPSLAEGLELVRNGNRYHPRLNDLSKKILAKTNSALSDEEKEFIYRRAAGEESAADWLDHSLRAGEKPTPIFWQLKNVWDFLIARVGAQSFPMDKVLALSPSVEAALAAATQLASQGDRVAIQYLREHLLEHLEFEYSNTRDFSFEGLIKNLREHLPKKDADRLIAILAHGSQLYRDSGRARYQVKVLLRRLRDEGFRPAAERLGKLLLNEFKGTRKGTKDYSVETLQEAMHFLFEGFEWIKSRGGDLKEIKTHLLWCIYQSDIEAISNSQNVRDWFLTNKYYLDSPYGSSYYSPQIGFQALWEDLKSGAISPLDAYFDTALAKIENAYWYDSCLQPLNILAFVYEQRGKRGDLVRVLLKWGIRWATTKTPLTLDNTLSNDVRGDDYSIQVLKSLADYANGDDPELSQITPIRKLMVRIIVDSEQLSKSKENLLLADQYFKASYSESTVSGMEEQLEFFKKLLERIIALPNHLRPAFAHIIFDYREHWPSVLFSNKSSSEYLANLKSIVAVFKDLSNDALPIEPSAQGWLEALGQLIGAPVISTWSQDDQSKFKTLIAERDKYVRKILFKIYVTQNDEAKIRETLLNPAANLGEPEMIPIATSFAEKDPAILNRLVSEIQKTPAVFQGVESVWSLLKRKYIEDRKRTPTFFSVFQGMIYTDAYSLADLREILSVIPKEDRTKSPIALDVFAQVLKKNGATPEEVAEAVPALRQVCGIPHSNSYGQNAVTALFYHTQERFPERWFTTLAPIFQTVPNYPHAVVKDFIRFAERCDVTGGAVAYLEEPEQGLQINPARLGDLAPRILDSPLDSKQFEEEMNRILDDVVAEEYRDLLASFRTRYNGATGDVFKKVGTYVFRQVGPHQDPKALMSLVKTVIPQEAALLVHPVQLRFGTLRPEIEAFQSFVQDTSFSEATPEEMEQGLSALIERMKPIEFSERQDRYFGKLKKYYTEDSDDGRKFRYFANAFLNLADPVEKRAKVSLYFEDIGRCRTGVHEANELQYNQARVSSASATEASETASTHGLPYHALVDAWVRQIKENILNQKLLVNPMVPRAAASQRVHLTIAMKRILGKELGLMAEGEEFVDDPIQTDSISAAFAAMGCSRCANWKGVLFRDFFMNYRPTHLVSTFTDLANLWMEKEGPTGFNRILEEWFKGENVENYFHIGDDTGKVTLTQEGAKRVLIKYGYLTVVN